MEPREMIQIDTNSVPWEERYQEALGKAMFLKPLLQDPDTGMIIRMVRYPAGFLNKWHFHTCSHDGANGDAGPVCYTNGYTRSHFHACAD